MMNSYSIRFSLVDFPPLLRWSTLRTIGLVHMQFERTTLASWRPGRIANSWLFCLANHRTMLQWPSVAPFMVRVWAQITSTRSTRLCEIPHLPVTDILQQQRRLASSPGRCEFTQNVKRTPNAY